MSRSPTEIDSTDLLQRASQLPERFFTAASAGSSPGGRGAALVLTREDVLNIKRYEYQALRLPADRVRLMSLGVGNITVPGLKPDDLLAVYVSITRHARTWAPIEESILRVGILLNQFASSFTAIGGSVLEIISQMGIVERASVPVDQLQLTHLKELERLALSDQNLKIKASLVQLLTLIQQRIKDAKQETDQVRDLTREFALAITQTLLPLVDSKLQIAREQGLGAKVSTLQKEIDDLQKRIEELRRAYTKTSSTAAWGIFGGPIGLAVTGGIYGAEAERIRKQKNALIKQVEGKTQELMGQQALLGALQRLDNLMQDVEFRMNDAEQSAINLRELWNLIGSYVDSSLNNLIAIEHDVALLVFAVEFRDVLQPWLSIGNLTGQMQALFELALKEARAEALSHEVQI